MTLVRWNPTKDLLNFEREFNKLWSNFGSRFGTDKNEKNENFENAVWAPLTDICEDKDNFYLLADLPGISKEDLKLSINDGQLSISGERKETSEQKEKTFHRVERTFGKYYRVFTLPDKVLEEKIEAEFKDGQLKIRIPKAEEVKPKEIAIKIN